MDLDPAASLFAGRKLKRRKPTTTGNQTPLPLTAGHHGSRRQGRERPVQGSGGEEKGSNRAVATGALTGDRERLFG
jgi:hypothetical protein